LVEETLRLSEQHQRQLLAKSCRLQEQLRELSHQVLQTREQERKRISRELHDVITQTLVGIGFHLEFLAQKGTVDQKVLRKKIVGAQRLLAKATKTIHGFAQSLRPTALDDLGLIAALHAYLNDFIMKTGIRGQFAVYADADKLGGDYRTALYRITQAALANVAEHSKASSVKVDLRKAADVVHLKISDDGEAFDVERALQAKRRRPLGLIDMRERTEMLGVLFQIESAPGKGTTISAQFPFRGSTKERAGN
jgi:signal transduction histidine kinase